MNINEANLLMKPYQSKLVSHAIAGAARDKVFQKLLTSQHEEIFALVGPSGVGKSTVLHRVQERLIEHYRDRMVQDPGFIPYISVTTVTGLDGTYSWRDGFARLLSAGCEPLVGKKESVKLQLDGQDITNARGLVRDEFRRAFESLVKNRRVKYIFLDEASAIFDAAVNRHPIRQFNILKSMCVSMNVTIVLGGAYDLLGFQEGTGQLIRRSEIIHMPRYQLSGVSENAESMTDLDCFAVAIKNLIQAIPVQIEGGLFADEPYYLIKSVGCVGIFKTWLGKAAVDALLNNDGLLTRAVMERNALSIRALEKLTTEAMFGEKTIRDLPSSNLAALYGLTSLAGFDQPTKSEVPNRKVKNGRVGLRGPSRDTAGGLHA